MRMRKKPNLDVRMDRCSELLVSDPTVFKGQWRQNYTSVLLEIGCGKGRFTVELAKQNPDKLLIAVERVPSAMVIAMERAREQNIQNLRFIDIDASHLQEFFIPGEVNAIYLNFCDPWPKSRDAKFRLTAPGFLRSYADILCENGSLYFKTDNTPLFDWSADQMAAEGWALDDITHDLHKFGLTGILTDYEAKFCQQGLKINSLHAVRKSDTKNTASGTLARLRHASLTDARGYIPSSEAIESAEKSVQQE